MSRARGTERGLELGVGRGLEEVDESGDSLAAGHGVRVRAAGGGRDRRDGRGDGWDVELGEGIRGRAGLAHGGGQGRVEMGMATPRPGSGLT